MKSLGRGSTFQGKNTFTKKGVRSAYEAKKKADTHKLSPQDPKNCHYTLSHPQIRPYSLKVGSKSTAEARHRQMTDLRNKNAH